MEKKLSNKGGKDGSYKCPNKKCKSPDEIEDIYYWNKADKSCSSCGTYLVQDKASQIDANVQ